MYKYINVHGNEYKVYNLFSAIASQYPLSLSYSNLNVCMYKFMFECTLECIVCINVKMCIEINAKKVYN